MSATDLDPDAARLMHCLSGARPDHARFTGAPIDLSHIDPLAFGDVWSVAEAIDYEELYRRERSLAGRMAAAIVTRCSYDVPAFRGAACRDYIERFVGRFESYHHRSRSDVQVLGRRISFALSRCTDLSFHDLRTLAARVLAICPWIEMPYVALVLGRIVGGAIEPQVVDVLMTEFARAPFVVDELRLAAALPLREAAILSDIVDISELNPTTPETDGPRYRLSGVPDYALFAHQVLQTAAGRVAAIHCGSTSYAADKAFTPLEARVVGRSLRLALDRDERWLPRLLEGLFSKVSIAPTQAKTMPSQAVAIALGHAIEAYPTPEAVVVLRQVLREVRHAGVEKKLQRNLRGAEKALAGRIEIALRLPSGAPVTKAAWTTATRALEATFAAPQPLAYGHWRARLADHPSGRGIAESLVWRLAGRSTDDVTVLLVENGGHLRLETAGGDLVAPDADCQIALWHPADAGADARRALRDLIVARRIKQPFKQVFREHYTIPEHDSGENLTDMFSGHAVSLRPLLGLARREGWRADGGNTITRSVGKWTVVFVLADEVAPGVTGWTTSGLVGIWAAAEPRWVPARFSDLSPVALSEILRSVDLLVSTSGFATTLEPGPMSEEPLRRAHLERLGDSPFGPMAEMRKDAIARILAGRPDMGSLRFDPRHLRLGSYAIHLATGRVTRGGDPVTIDLSQRSSLAAVPWLPYDEKLMETIVLTAIEIARVCDVEA